MALDKSQKAAEFRATSWQLELLITGGIIYTLYTSTDFFKAFYVSHYPILDFNHYKILGFFGVYILSRALLFGFGANLILRTVWFAYKAIDYWYPQGIAFKNLDVPTYKKTQLKQANNAEARLNTLEKWASLSFSFAILFTFIVVSTLVVCLLICSILLEVFGLEDLVYYPAFNYGLAIVILLTQLGVFQGLNVKTKFARLNALGSFLSKVYYYVSGLFLYQRELLVLRTNGRKWVLVAFGSLYLVLASLISINQIGEFYDAGTFEFNWWDSRKTYEQPTVYSMNSRRYGENLKEGDGFFLGGIQSEVVKDKHIKLFVVHWNWFDGYMQHAMDSLQMKAKAPKFESDSVGRAFYNEQHRKYQKAVNSLIKVKIDSTEIPELRWERYKHPKTQEEGYLSYILADSLNTGRHTMQVFRQIHWKETRRQSWFSLPFWVE
ncbi:hypothetical protein [Spongiimicrobium salis]|uniref:hypothetical protein n=1 Tax=Spongiimicrobium salis TaxID=1667022 RepID=UPI00374CF4D7